MASTPVCMSGWSFSKGVELYCFRCGIVGHRISEFPAPVAMGCKAKVASVAGGMQPESTAGEQQEGSTSHTKDK